MKKALLIACGLLCTVAHADWVIKVIHPSGASSSYIANAFGASQVGYATISDIRRASLWTGTAASWKSLHPAGYTKSMANDCSDTQQVGFVQNGDISYACLWQGTAASFVKLHPAGATSSFCDGVYGTKQYGSATFSGNDHAGMWAGTAASWVDLNPPGATVSHIAGAGAAHQVGDAQYGDIFKAVMWSGTAASAVVLHPSGADSSFAYATEGTHQVGVASIEGLYHAALWSGTSQSFVDLNPSAATESNAYGVLGNMQVGGYTTDFSGNYRACFWTGTAASKVDLHAYLPANYTNSQATAIATDGANIYIAGDAYNSTTSRFEALLWTVETVFALTLNKATVAGQNSVQGTISLTSASPTALVFSTYDNSSLVTTPATVTVPAGSLVKNFQITVTAVTSSINTTIYAKFGSVTHSQPLTLAPLIPTALSFTPNPVTGGQPTSCKVVINGVAGPGGRVIAILDNSSYSTVPSTVTVPAGASSVSFSIGTTHPTIAQNVTVTARVSAGQKTGTFRINP